MEGKSTIWVVYAARNTLNSKFYIGLTLDLNRRQSQHVLAARQGLNTPFARAVRKYGWEAFEFAVLETYATEAEAKAAERRAIAVYQTQNRRFGYNVADGGDGLGSEGARQVHRRPGFRRALLESMPSRHAKAQATKRANGTNTSAAIKAAATREARRMAEVRIREGELLSRTIT